MTKNTKLWYLYDFANSFAVIILVFYYPLLLAEKGASNIWIGVSASIATLILLIILPYLGTYSDKIGKRIFFIRIASVFMVLAIFALAFLTQYIQVFSVTMLFILSFFYILFQVCFQGSFVFYSAMLNHISDRDNNAKISGIGFGFGQLGNFLGLAIAGLILGSSLIIFGLSGKSLILFIGGILFVIFSIPFLRQKEIKNNNIEKINFSYKEFFKKIFSEKRILFFLIGYSLLADAVLTFQLYLTLYIKNVFSFSDKFVTYSGLTVLIFATFAGFLVHKFVFKLGDKEKALRASAIFYAIAFCILVFVPKINIFIFISLALAGLAFGFLFSLARVVYSEISPENQQGEFFSIFTVFERAASVIGPLLWLLTFYLLKDFGENIQYRGSLFFLALICFAGYYFLIKSNSINKIIKNN